jgi:hypothetical protein
MAVGGVGMLGSEMKIEKRGIEKREVEVREVEKREIERWVSVGLTWLIPNWTKTTRSVSTMGSLRSAQERTPVPPRDWLVYCE